MQVGCVSKLGLSRSEFNETLRQRFASKCGSPDSNGCIPWLGALTHKGYGSLLVGKSGPKTTAHRIAWVLNRSDLPAGVLVLHSCDNRSCVNADHLFLGSPQDNTADMVSKGRHPWRHGTPWQKLNSTDGERVRDLRRAGLSQQDVADWIGVSRPLISMVESGQIKHSAVTFLA